MDFIEVIGPIIFLVLFGLGKMFEKIQEQGSKRLNDNTRREEGGQPQPEESDSVWAEVRRRIQERTAAESETPVPPLWLEEDPEPVVKAPPPPPPAPLAPRPIRKRHPQPRPQSVQETSPSMLDQLDLRGRKNLRRAFLYREILGPPVALRKGGGEDSLLPSP